MCADIYRDIYEKGTHVCRRACVCECVKGDEYTCVQVYMCVFV